MSHIVQISKLAKAMKCVNVREGIRTQTIHTATLLLSPSTVMATSQLSAQSSPRVFIAHHQNLRCMKWRDRPHTHTIDWCILSQYTNNTLPVLIYFSIRHINTGTVVNYQRNRQPGDPLQVLQADTEGFFYALVACRFLSQNVGICGGKKNKVR